MKNYKILKNIYICLALLSTVLLVGCSKSDETPAPEEQPLGKGKITFNVHTPGAFLTRAVGVGDENGGTNDKITFYQFSKEGTRANWNSSTTSLDRPPLIRLPTIAL